MRLVVATSNAGKAKELSSLVAGRASVETLLDHPDVVMPPETGETFEANAIAKAEHLAKELDCVVIADDSGLEVDALDRRPGVLSARYVEGSDADRSEKILKELGDERQRTARFVCAMALARPGSTSLVVRGTVEGKIGRARRGTGGFGYDPIFELPDGRTMAELSMDEKNEISHRGRALRALWPQLEALISTSSAKVS
ncbi:MAG: RdgB/HAM1 family non-canonical purine NTP pyrophosphatase [Deltaproteobacteria bacterium]|nr:RdgB/HAM1 family non-canonical purine NTP pyrophosphatase [Deltaproteobacteria bacterium]